MLCGMLLRRLKFEGCCPKVPTHVSEMSHPVFVEIEALAKELESETVAAFAAFLEERGLAAAAWHVRQYGCNKPPPAKRGRKVPSTDTGFESFVLGVLGDIKNTCKINNVWDIIGCL